MAIKDFAATKTFGKSASTVEDKPKAKFWLNLGYTAQGEDGEDKFVSLPTGIPLDTQEPLDVKKINNDDFRQLRSAQNNLLEELIAYAESTLQPGQETVIQLQVQLRRVKEDAEPIPASENKYARNTVF